MLARLPGCSALTLLPLMLAGAASAQEPDAPTSVGRQMVDGLLSSFSLPLGDLLVKKHESEWRNLLDGFSGSVGFSYPLRDRDLGNLGRGGSNLAGQPLSPALELSLRYNPLSYWFIGATAYKYLGEQQSYEPDFSYTFGYDDYHPYTLSLVYSNYNANRFSPDQGESAVNFQNGTWTLGWKFPVPERLAEPLLIERSSQIACQVGYNVSPRFYDMASQGDEHWHEALSLGCNYPIYKGLFLNWTAYYYPDPSDQQPYDPDYTYVLGYNVGPFSIQYSNYSGNRYPWRNPEGDNGRFGSGAIGISWSWSW